MLHSVNKQIYKPIKHTQISVYWEIYKQSDQQNGQEETDKKKQENVEAEKKEASKLSKLKEAVEAEKEKQELNLIMKLKSENEILLSALEISPVSNSVKDIKK